jgi:hypothetical protein
MPSIKGARFPSIAGAGHHVEFACRPLPSSVITLRLYEAAALPARRTNPLHTPLEKQDAADLHDARPHELG